MREVSPASDGEATVSRPATGGGSAIAALAAPVLAPFLLLLVMDLLARTGYQMGKSPVLPLFAQSLGAGAEASGAVVAISTITGLAMSPLIGALSDLYGRRRLLLVGTSLFAFTPFVYLLIRTPEQLALVRLVHGFATAVYGPVVSALVADLCQKQRGAYMGWYRSVRTASYLLGPLLGGFVLVYADFRTAWIVVGILGAAAFIPALWLPGLPSPAPARRRPGKLNDFGRRLVGAFRSPRLLALGIVEAALYLGLRANKAFLPLYGEERGINPAQVGMLFSIQVATTLVAQPGGGYLADRWGRKRTILAGLLVTACALPLMMATRDRVALALLSVVLGLGEAAVMPSVIALSTELSQRDRYGATLGMLDAMDNVGKALGPIVAGLLIGVWGYTPAFIVLALGLGGIAVLFFAFAQDLG